MNETPACLRRRALPIWMDLDGLSPFKETLLVEDVLRFVARKSPETGQSALPDRSQREWDAKQRELPPHERPSFRHGGIQNFIDGIHRSTAQPNPAFFSKATAP